VDEEALMLKCLREKHHCPSHKGTCMIGDDGKHSSLTIYHLKLWAKEIVSKHAVFLHNEFYLMNQKCSQVAERATVEEPPVTPMFASARTRAISEPAVQMTVAQPMPPTYMLPFCSPVSCLHGSSHVQHPTLSAPLHVPSLSTFLNDLDQKYGKGEYTNYEKNFLAEKVDVAMIAHLSDAQLIGLGVSIMGHRVALQIEAKKYQYQ
jgi:hypothetical protein